MSNEIHIQDLPDDPEAWQEWANELENERYEPVLDSWVQMQNDIYKMIMEALFDETTEMGDTPQP